MRLSKTKTAIVGVAFSAVALLSAGATSGTEAVAQVRFRRVPPNRVVIANPRPRVFVAPRVFVGPRFYHPGFYSGFYQPYYSYTEAHYAAEQTGYHDGFVRGKDDAKHGMASSPESHKHYSGSSNGTYREAFLRGYEDGYRQYAG